MAEARVVQAGEQRSARVESLRALAALGVLEAHVFGWSRGWDEEAIYGSFFDRIFLVSGSTVILFFALTGYLLFMPFGRRWFAGGDRIDIGRYATNRALRILPLYFASIVLLLLIAEGGGTLEQWLKYGLMSQNFFSDTVGQLNGPLWSVVVEMHFYLLLPFFAYALAKASRGSLRAAAVILLVLAVASALLRANMRDVYDGDVRLLQYSLPTTFYWFCAGMFVAMLRIHWGERRPPWLKGVLASPTAWLAATIPLWLLQADRFSDWPVAIASFLTVGACVLPLREERSVRALEWRPLALLGIASYSLYVWHDRIAEALSDAGVGGYFALLPATLILSIAAAWASYRLIEAPFLRLRRRWSKSSAPQSKSEPDSRVASEPLAAS